MELLMGILEQADCDFYIELTRFRFDLCFDLILPRVGVGDPSPFFLRLLLSEWIEC